MSIANWPKPPHHNLLSIAAECKLYLAWLNSPTNCNIFQNKLPFAYHLQLGLHSWAIVLSVLVLGITMIGIRSVYVLTFSMIFYALSLAVNLLTTLHDRGYRWSSLFKCFQVIPFLYISSLIYTFIVAMTPMNGRSGSASNPDTMISGFPALFCLEVLAWLEMVVQWVRVVTTYPVNGCSPIAHQTMAIHTSCAFRIQTSF